MKPSVSRLPLRTEPAPSRRRARFAASSASVARCAIRTRCGVDSRLYPAEDASAAVDFCNPVKQERRGPQVRVPPVPKTISGATSNRQFRTAWRSGSPGWAAAVCRRATRRGFVRGGQRARTRRGSPPLCPSRCALLTSSFPAGGEMQGRLRPSTGPPLSRRLATLVWFRLRRSGCLI
jgi:hypothetical protein